jgi:biopolymer transport protein ExbD
MKLESRLPTGAGLLHVAPLVDVVALLVIFFLLGSGYVMRSGVAVELPTSPFTMERVVGEHVVSISGDANPSLTLDDLQLAGLEDLNVRLKELAANAGDKKEDLILLIQADRNARNGFVFDVKVAGLKNNFSIVEAAQFELQGEETP